MKILVAGNMGFIGPSVVNRPSVAANREDEIMRQISCIRNRVGPFIVPIPEAKLYP